MKKQTILKSIIFTLFIFCNILIINAQDTLCKTKYPIVLVHGIGFKDNVLIKRYWGRIPQNLRKNGATVYLANVDGLGTMENNGIQLKKMILEIVETTNCEKVNLITHSKGGVDARYMLSKLEMSDYVASVTLISNPNTGTVWADLGLYSLEYFRIKKLAIKISYIYGKYILFDKNPTPLKAYNQSTSEFMTNYSKTLKDVESVYYQSYGSFVKTNYPSLTMKYRRKKIYESAKESDGVVPVLSSEWTNFKLVGENSKYGVSHFDIIGFFKVAKFDEIYFFNSLVYSLKLKNF